MLEFEGKLKATDSIYRYLPELKNFGNITILNLMQHTSGYRDYLIIFSLRGI
jgi:CubicO group peptidase (beta-lactamase class C family)